MTETQKPCRLCKGHGHCLVRCVWERTKCFVQAFYDLIGPVDFCRNWGKICNGCGQTGHYTRDCRSLRHCRICLKQHDGFCLEEVHLICRLCRTTGKHMTQNHDKSLRDERIKYVCNMNNLTDQERDEIDQKCHSEIGTVHEKQYYDTNKTYRGP